MTGRQRHKWQYLVKDIEQFAKDEGCQMMELIARPGWQKVLNNYGYQRTHVVLEKKIKQEEKNEFWRRRFISRSRYRNTNSSTLYSSTTSIKSNISEAGQIYGSGVGEYVAPTQQTLTGLAGQETLGTAAQQQLASTLLVLMQIHI